MKIKNLMVASILALGTIGAISTAAANVRMFVRHQVADYASWRKVDNDFVPTQMKMGVIFRAVFQSTDDPNDVTVILDFPSADQAKAFAVSPEFKTEMQNAGVKSTPQIWVVTKRLT